MNDNTQSTNDAARNNGSNYNAGQNNNNNYRPNTGNYAPQQNYQKKKSTGIVVFSIILILMGVSYVVDQFLPWVFDWLDSGLIVASAAIIIGFSLLIKK